MPPPHVPYHRQQGEDFCGAACLQMVIEALGLSSSGQSALFKDAHGHGTQDPKSVGWASPPDGLGWALEHRAKRATADVLSPKAEATLTRGLVWSLFRHSCPPIALIYGFAHWVVVVNYDISRNPKGPSDGGYVVKALDIHDPWRRLKEGNPPPPPPPRHVTMKAWESTYLKPVPTGHWKDSVVAVGVFTP